MVVKTYLETRNAVYAFMVSPECQKHRGDMGDIPNLTEEERWAMINEAHIFEIDSDILRLLAITNPPKDLKKDEIKLPFNTIFLDAEISKENGYPIADEVIKGVCATIVDVIDQHKEPLGRLLRYFNYTIGNDGMHWMNNGSYPLDITETQRIKGFKVKTGDKDLTDNHNVLKNLLINFVLFLDSEDVEIVRVERNLKGQQRRAKRGKPMLPSSSVVRLTGKLKTYVNSMKQGGHFSYGYQFWVRGHWRTLRSKRYKEKQGTRLWIPPYVKGDGILIENTYKVKTEMKK